MEAIICPACGREKVPVYVHGHYQCSNCGTNIVPCCGGEQAGDEE